MKRNIFYDDVARIGVSCDGKKVEVFGDNVLMKMDFQNIMNSGYSMYNRIKDKAKDNFDPVGYFAKSMTLWPSSHIVEYNEHNLKQAVKAVTDKQESLGKRRGKNGNGR